MSVAAHALPDRELVLERYRPLRPLGRGGSGSVWLSRDERTGLDVALKIVPREGKRAARAEREMEAASRLRHPRCVRAYEYGEDDGHVYIAYELVHGRTLREVLRHDGLSDADAVEAAAQMLEALGHAHARGVVHRDVKPSNVILEDGPRVSTKLLDFGLAQFDEADTLTAVGDVPGTLAYIAPERLTGAEASARSDVWAVGVFLWEALTGGHPFWGVPLPEVASAITSGAPPLAERRPELPRRLLAAVDSALSLDPAGRPPAARLAAELREAFVVQRRPERPQRSRPSKAAPSRAEQPERSVSIPRAARLGSAALATVTTATGATLLPFWPAGLVIALALAAALVTLRSPRVGLAIALAAPTFALGNFAKGAALAWTAFAVVWLAANWRDARGGLAFVAGPLLAPLGLLPLVPLAAQAAASPWRRSLQAFLSVPAAALVAGLAGRPLPLGGETVPDLGLVGTESPLPVIDALATVLRAQPHVLTVGLVLAAATVALPAARAKGLPAVAALALLQATLLLLAAPAAAPVGVFAASGLLPVLLGVRPAIAAVARLRDGYHR
ncbi:MAG: serine/threonine-protein kinase [Gaiellales bacterium]